MLGHLPGIPSAAEVEANGISLSEMQSRLLQKVEELTLHMIALEKENGMLWSSLDNLTSTAAAILEGEGR